MKKNILNTMGINASKDIPVEDIFNPAINKENYGLDETDVRKIRALKRFCYQYNSEKPVRKRTSITSSLHAANLMYDILRGLEHEEVWVAYLNKSASLIDKEQISIGGLDQTVIDKKRILRNALNMNASSIILFHNHPSGDSKPSKADIKETEALKKMCDVFETCLLDHIIISDTEFFSFADDSVTNIINEK